MRDLKGAVNKSLPLNDLLYVSLRVIQSPIGL
jgi:hypothetical protein